LRGLGEGEKNKKPTEKRRHGPQTLEDPPTETKTKKGKEKKGLKSRGGNGEGGEGRERERDGNDIGRLRNEKEEKGLQQTGMASRNKDTTGLNRDAGGRTEVGWGTS